MTYEEKQAYITEALTHASDFSQHFYLEANSMASQRISFSEGGGYIEYDSSQVYGSTEFIDIYASEDGNHYGYVEQSESDDDGYQVARIIMAAKSCGYDYEKLEQALADMDILLQN